MRAQRDPGGDCGRGELRERRLREEREGPTGGVPAQRDGASATLAGGTGVNGLRRAARATLGCCACARWAARRGTGASRPRRELGRNGRGARRGNGLGRWRASWARGEVGAGAGLAMGRAGPAWERGLGWVLGLVLGFSFLFLLLF